MTELDIFVVRLGNGVSYEDILLSTKVFFVLCFKAT